MQPPDTSRISPTAHYTAYVWYRNGLAEPALATPTGRRMYRVLQAADALYSRVLRRPNLEGMLLARHRIIDHLLARAIDSGYVRGVIELAAGLSSRGLRFARRFPWLRVVEGDLPAMIETKRRLLDAAGLLRPNHELVAINALADDTPDSLAAVARARLEEAPAAIVCEGLLAYFDRPTVDGILARCAACLRERGGGVFLANIITQDRADHLRFVAAFRRFLGALTRGSVSTHFRNQDDGREALRAAGFDNAAFHHPAAFLGHLDIPGPDPERHLVSIIEAVCAPRRG